MTRNNKVNIILLKASWCPHCVAFEPIYKKAISLSKQDKELDNVDFELIETSNDMEYMAIKKKYDQIEKYVDGYPTVIYYTEINNKPIYKQIETTQAKIGDENDIKLAAMSFLNNINNENKTIKSDNYDEYKQVQNGGKHSEEYYKKKYLKYKNKYLNTK